MTVEEWADATGRPRPAARPGHRGAARLHLARRAARARRARLLLGPDENAADLDPQVLGEWLRAAPVHPPPAPARGTARVVDRPRGQGGARAGRPPTVIGAPRAARARALPGAAVPGPRRRPPAARGRRAAVGARGEPAPAAVEQRTRLPLARRCRGRRRIPLAAVGLLPPLWTLRLGRRRDRRRRARHAPVAVWSKSATDQSVSRAWISCPGEAAEGSPDVRVGRPRDRGRRCQPTDRSGPGAHVPVLVTPDAKAAKDEQCPSCGRPDGIRFLGSRVATLASAALGQLFGSPDIAAAEKKTLVFTDCVQDASHRAAFVESRAYALNLRALVHRALGDEGLRARPAGRRASRAAADDPAERYAVLPPDLRRARGRSSASGQTEKPEDRVRRAVATAHGASPRRSSSGSRRGPAGPWS